MSKFYLLFISIALSGISSVFAQPATLDQSFGNKGLSVTDSARFGMKPKIALQADDKILVATNANNKDRGFIVMRYQRNGSLDSSFGVNGSATKVINRGYEFSSAIAVQPDGKILVGGSTSFNYNGQTQFVLIRYTTQGKLDSSFATNGVHILPIVNASDAVCTVTDVMIRPAGKIVVAGHAANSLGISYFAYEQLNQNGSLDSSFGVNGSFTNRVFTDFDFNSAIDSTNKLIGGGIVSQYLYFGIRRYKTNGTVDSSFGYNGTSDMIPDFRSRDALIEPDGKIVFYGQSLAGSDYRMALARFDPSGKLDRTFGDTGVVYKSFGNLGNNAGSFVRQPDGKYIIVGSSTPNFLIRYNHNGSIDSSFGRGGIVNTFFPGSQFFNGDAVLQADGKVLLAGTATVGSFGSYVILSRYEKNAPDYYNLIKGTVFLDKNSNGIKEQTEPVFSYAKIITSKPGYDTITTIATTNSFDVYVDTGSYSTTIVPYKPYYSPNPATRNTSHATYYNTDSLLFAMQPVPGKRDVAIQVIPVDVARPGFQNKYVLFYKNQGTDTVTGTIEFIKDSKLTFSTSVPAPGYLNGDTLRWTFSGLKPMDTASIRVNMVVKAPPTVIAGDTLSSVVTINSTLPDLTPADNRSAITQVVRGSFDPNDKRESHGGQMRKPQVANGDYLYYTIRFQNTGNDTAFNVYIRDTLSNKVDWNSFEIIAASSKFQASINDGRCLFTLNDIKLVDSVKNEPLSHGYLVYRVKPLASLAVGETILNKAAIYFDYNLPVFTNNEMTTIVADALPLRLLSFIARKEGLVNVLKWNTASEVNVDGFEVERSANGSKFSIIGYVNAGSSLYQFKDESPYIGSNYYRLKIKDRDGAFVYSAIVVLNGNPDFSVSVYPNPAREDIQLHISLERKNTIQVQVMSLDGKILLTKNLVVEGSLQEKLNIRNLKSGAYYLKLSQGKDVRVMKFVKM